MNSTSSQFVWRVIGASQRGAAHSRTGSVCQDAIHWLPEHGVGPPIIVSIADGHGSNKHFRSGIGARLAVDAVEASFCELLHGIRRGVLSNLYQIKSHVEGELPRNIVKNWLKNVEEHSRSAPFDPSEVVNPLKGLRSEADKASFSVESKLPVYGSTVVSVFIHKLFIVYIQLGDGDILTVSEQGDSARVFNTQLLGTETNSLSESRLVWISSHEKTNSKINNEDDFGTLRTIKNFQVRFEPIEENLIPPALIFLSTDGLANSYKNEPDFQKFSLDVYNKFAERRFDEVYKEISEALPIWLYRITNDGSGDDVTLSIICRENI